MNKQILTLFLINAFVLSSCATAPPACGSPTTNNLNACGRRRPETRRGPPGTRLSLRSAQRLLRPVAARSGAGAS